MAISLNQSILKAKNSDGEWQNLSAIGQIEGYTKSETDSLLNSHTPQLLFSGVTSASAPAVVDLSGYGMVYIRVDRWESGCLVETQGQYDITTIQELLDTPSYNTITIGAAASQKVIISGTLDSCSMYNNSSRHTVIYGITQHTVLAITTQPTDQTVAVGSTVHLTVNAVGDGLTYQWYWSRNDGQTWGTTSNVTGKTNDYSFATKTDYNGYQYRCIITDKYGATITSDVATLTVTNLAITTQPTDLAMTVGETDTFHVDAVGDELTYQWYISTDGGVNWRGSGTTGNKTDTLYINNAKVDYNGYKYKCKITDKYGATVTSSVATLTVTS